jgi:hypothetical protein
MNASPDARSMAARAVQNFATQLRESAQANIVSSFRAYLEDGGQGPTDSELRIFARLAAYEHRIRSLRPEGPPPPPDVIRPKFVESESLAPPSPVAFGDLVDLARYRRGLDGEVCAACQTINPLASKFCKGCAGRLPAFYATIAPASAKPRAGREAVVSHPVDVGINVGALARTRNRRVRVSATALASALVAVLVAALVPWGASPGSANPPLRDRSIMSSLGAAPAPEAAHLTPQVAAIEQQRPVVEQPDAKAGAGQPPRASVEASVEPAGAAMIPLRQPQRKLAAAPPRNAPRPLARPADTWGAVASCGGLNFLSRAVCMNNVCAQPGMSRSGQCVDAVRQRRLDEARRNPTLVG